MIRWLSILVVIMAVTGSAEGAEPPLRVLIDGSGSMRGFVASGAAG